MISARLVIPALALLTGCATFQPGDRATSDKLKDFDPIPGKVSVYVCRIPAFAAGGVTSTILINDIKVGTVRPNSFVHASVPAGKVTVNMQNDGLALNVHRPVHLEAAAGEIIYVRVGITGLLMTYGLERFSSIKQGQNCVQNAVYSVQAS